MTNRTYSDFREITAQGEKLGDHIALGSDGLYYIFVMGRSDLLQDHGFDSRRAARRGHEFWCMMGSSPSFVPPVGQWHPSRYL